MTKLTWSPVAGAADDTTSAGTGGSTEVGASTNVPMNGAMNTSESEAPAQSSRSPKLVDQYHWPPCTREMPMVFHSTLSRFRLCGYDACQAASAWSAVSVGTRFSPTAMPG